MSSIRASTYSEKSNRSDTIRVGPVCKTLRPSRIKMSGCRTTCLAPGMMSYFEMRVHRRTRVVGTGFHRGHEPHQRPAVVTLRKTFAVHEVSSIQLGVGVEKTVGGHQVDPGVVIPASQQRLQHTGGGRLAHGHAAGHADDERHRPVRVLLRLAEEFRCGGKQSLAGGDLKMNEPGQRQVNLFDLEQVDLLAQTAQADQFLFGEGQRRRHAERAPLLSVELHIGARLAKPRHSASVAGTDARPTAGLAKSAAG